MWRSLNWSLGVQCEVPGAAAAAAASPENLLEEQIMGPTQMY